MMVKCPSCGFVRKDNPTTNQMREFSRLLREAQKEDAALGGKKATNTLGVIQSFIIPNTIEDITEFMVLAESHVCNLSDVIELNSSERSRVVSAWEVKADQAYAKAKSLFADDEAFASIERSHERIEAHARTRETTNAVGGCLAGVGKFFAVLIGIAIVFLFVQMFLSAAIYKPGSVIAVGLVILAIVIAWGKARK